MAADPKPFSEAELLTLAARGVHKVDLLGERGATNCTQNEIIAMAALLKVVFTTPSKPVEAPTGGPQND